MMRALTLWVTSLAALLCASVIWATQYPAPPRNGRHSVQMIVGGRDTIPMCIVPPRTYEDGSAIAPGTQCTIVIYRSRQAGKPGTYTEEVGRGTGPIERDWIDVGAKAPPDSSGPGAIYLASCAYVNSQWSMLNNQFLTIVWSPGNFSVKEYPDAGSQPGYPPGRKPVAPEKYPDWLLALGEESVSGGGGGWSIKTPTLTQLGSFFESDRTMVIHLKEQAGGVITGNTDLSQVLAEAEEDQARVSVKRNDVTGKTSGTSLQALASIEVQIVTAYGGRTATAVLSAQTTLQGTVGGGRDLQGRATTNWRVTVTGDPPHNGSKVWDFAAAGSGTGAGGTGLLFAPDSLGGASAAPASGLSTGACRAAGVSLSSPLARKSVGVVPLDIGGSHFFTVADRRAGYGSRGWDDNYQALKSAERDFSEPAQWYVGPAGVLEEIERLGDGVKVRAVGEGMGEVWARTHWRATLADGTTGEGYMVIAWVVPVGSAARAVAQSGTGSTALPPGYTGPVVADLVITGRAVRRGSGEGVGGAHISLWGQGEQGGTYYQPEWVTQPNGNFKITVDASLPGGGVIPGTYEVMIQWRPAGAAVGRDVTSDITKTWVDADLWPVKRHLIKIIRKQGKQKINVPEPVVLDRCDSLDWSARD